MRPGLKEVQEALSSINMPLEEWQKSWAFDFRAEFNAGTTANDVAMMANRFWWHQQNKAIKQDCRLSQDCWLPRGHQGKCQPVSQNNPTKVTELKQSNQRTVIREEDLSMDAIGPSASMPGRDNTSRRAFIAGDAHALPSFTKNNRVGDRPAIS